MANTDIRLAVSFRDHRKRKKLNYLMGLQKSGTDYLIDLWISVANDRPDGVLAGWDELDIAMAAGWDGDAREFADHLIKAKWLDYDEESETYSMHDWAEYQGWVMGAKKRSEKARKAALARHGQAQSEQEECSGHATSTKQAKGKQAHSNAPSPSPSPSPSPNLKHTAQEVYRFYLDTIDPLKQSKDRAIKNIKSKLKKYSPEDLRQSILNYKSIITDKKGEFDREKKHRKLAANFFGINENFCEDFLPENFVPDDERVDPDPEFNGGETFGVKTGML